MGVPLLPVGILPSIVWGRHKQGNWFIDSFQGKKQTQQNPSKTYTLLFHLNLVLPFLETVLWKFLLWSKGSSLDRSVGKAHRSCLNLHCLRTNTLSPPPTVQWFPRLRSRQMAHGNRLMFHLENDLLILSLFSPPPTIIWEVREGQRRAGGRLWPASDLPEPQRATEHAKSGPLEYAVCQSSSFFYVQI